MSAITADLFVTLDGFASGEGAPAYFGYPGPDLEAWVLEELRSPQVILLGRVTYEVLSAISSRGGAPGRLDELPKLVVSRTLSDPLGWNARVVAPEELPRLKQEAGEPLRCMGSLSLVRSLLADGLLDRLRLMVFPQILGATGREPTFAGLPDVGLELVDERVLDSRLVLLEYRPAG